MASLYETFQDNMVKPPPRPGKRPPMKMRKPMKNNEETEEDEMNSMVETVEEFRNNRKRRGRGRGRKDKEEFVNNVDLQEMVRRIVKYLVEGLAVGVVGMALVLRKKRGNVNFNLQARDVSVMAVTAAAVFSILDMYAPSISGSARQGAGFGLGANLVGFPVMR